MENLLRDCLLLLCCLVPLANIPIVLFLMASSRNDDHAEAEDKVLRPSRFIPELDPED